MINNRQTGRRRGRGGGNGNGSGNGQRQGGGMQGNGSRIDNRARGNATQLFEKYKNMASDAQRQGDRVNTEYYLQFADHYFRVLSEQRGKFEDQQQQPRQPRNDFDYEGDDEFGEEGEPIRAGEQGDAQREQAQRAEREPERDNRSREFRRDRDGNRDAGRDGNRDAPRDAGRDNNYARQSNDARPDNRNEANTDGRQDGARREWRDRDDRAPRRNGEYRDQRPAEPEVVAGQRRAEPISPGVSPEQRADEVLAADRPLDPPARRRGRPRREEGEAVNDADAASSGFEADRLPPALTPTLAVAVNDEGESAPRRRRVRRPADETPTAAE